MELCAYEIFLICKHALELSGQFISLLQKQGGIASREVTE